ncbi:acyltransferase family protein [Megalodesulfovibrio paquesii]
MIRILATMYVFYFHWCGLHQKDPGDWIELAFSAFMYLTGYYCLTTSTDIKGWLLRRLRRIYLPYVQVCLLVIVANAFFEYKQVGLWQIISMLAGFNFFIRDPLYVVTWFVSVVLAYYVGMYAWHAAKTVPGKCLAAGGTLGILTLAGLPLYFTGAFLIGYAVHATLRRMVLLQVEMLPQGSLSRMLQRSYPVVMWMQNLSYEFFLLHGGVLLFCIKILRLGFISSGVLAFAATVACALLLKHTTAAIERRWGTHGEPKSGVA